MTILRFRSFWDFLLMSFPCLPDMRQHTIYPDCDIKFTGHVSWVGKTSIEAKMHMSQVDAATHSRAQDLFMCHLNTFKGKNWCWDIKSWNQNPNTNGNPVTLLSVPQWSLRPSAGRYVRDGGTRSREQEVEQHPSRLCLCECKAAKKLLNALVSNVFLLSYHRIMGKNSNAKRSSQISFSFMRKQCLKMSSIIDDVTVIVLYQLF